MPHHERKLACDATSTRGRYLILTARSKMHKLHLDNQGESAWARTNQHAIVYGMGPCGMHHTARAG